MTYLREQKVEKKIVEDIERSKRNIQYVLVGGCVIFIVYLIGLLFIKP